MGRKLNSVDVVDALTDLFILRGPPKFIRSDSGLNTPCAPLRDVIAEKVRDWIAAVGAQTHAARASLRDVNARFRDELLNSEIFFSLREAAPRANDPLERFLILGSLIEQWRRHDNTVRRHSALGYQPPAPEAIIPIDQRPVMHEQSSRTNQRGQSIDERQGELPRQRPNGSRCARAIGASSGR